MRLCVWQEISMHTLESRSLLKIKAEMYVLTKKFDGVSINKNV